MADDLEIAELSDFGLAALMLRRNGDISKIGEAFRMEMPRAPACVIADGKVLLGTGPGTWLAFSKSSSVTLTSQLGSLAQHLSVSDQTGGYVIFKLSGAEARAVLQAGAYIDLTASAFGIGSAATTVIAHMGVIIWQIEDADAFHVALFRSYAASFREWLKSALNVKLD